MAEGFPTKRIEIKPMAPAETAPEPKAALRDGVEKVQDALAERAGVKGERETMRTAETEYLAAYKDFYAKNNALARLGKRIWNTKDNTHLEELKRRYNVTRKDYGDAMVGSVRTRLESKSDETAARLRLTFDKLPREKVPMGKDKKPMTFEEYQAFYNDRVEKRYNRLVRFNEVVKPTAEKMYRTRVEALDAKGQTVFEKGLMWFNRNNKDFEKWAGGKTQARFWRAAAMAGVGVAGAGAAIAAGGVLATGSILALGSIGAARFARSLVGGVVAPFTGKLGGRLGEWRGRKEQKRSVDALKTEGRTSGELSLKGFDRTDRMRVHMHEEADERTVQKKRAGVAIVGSFAGGGLAGAIVDFDFSHATSAAVGAHAEHALAAHFNAFDMPIEKGAGANEFFRQFQQSLEAHGYSIHDKLHTPESIKRILEAHDPGQLSDKFEFRLPGQHAELLQGDTLGVDAKGNIIFTRHGDPIALMDSSGRVVATYPGDMVSDAVAHHVHHSVSHHEPRTQAEADDIEATRELNRESLHDPAGFAAREHAADIANGMTPHESVPPASPAADSTIIESTAHHDGVSLDGAQNAPESGAPSHETVPPPQPGKPSTIDGTQID